MAKIVLTTPNTRPMYYDTVLFDFAEWWPTLKKIVLRFSCGYIQEDGTWRETWVEQDAVENTEGNLAYDGFSSMINSTDLSVTPLDILVLKAYLARFPGELMV